VKLATYQDEGIAKIGVVDAEAGRLFDLAAAAKRASADDSPFRSMLSLIDADEAGLDAARGLAESRGPESDLWIDLAAAKLLAPLPEPRQMRDAMSFALHIRQSGRGARAIQPRRAKGAEAFKSVMQEPLEDLPAVYRELPIFYITNRFTVVGTGTTVHWPRYSEVMDYELEVAIVTRRTRANIPRSEARRAYLRLYDLQRLLRPRAASGGNAGPARPAKGKSFDGSNVLGPWIVTPDEIGDPQTLKVEVRVNGETRAIGDTREMLFPFEEILAYASQDETIHAGEIFGSGTVGNCCGLEIARFLESGDIVELSVDRIGILKNEVVRQA
jgi:2-keto-4-pentenoate hydratase/2-oxohepta-3-ene-1,7-dioic acid hydratase in catechol pathway